MVKHEKPWIFTRAREFEPGGQLRLGQILTDPYKPRTGRITKKGPLFSEDDIQVDRGESDLHLFRSEDMEGAFKFWAKLYGVPASLAAKAKATYKYVEDWKFDLLKGEVMTFSDAYAREALDDSNVVNYIASRSKISQRFDALYMVTGVRVAVGAKMTRSESSSVQVEQSASADLSSISAPAEAGESVSGSHANETRESFNKAKDFVFQYQLFEIKYAPRFKARPYSDGEAETLGEEGVEPAPEVEGLKFAGWGDAVGQSGEDKPDVRCFTFTIAGPPEPEYVCYLAPDELTPIGRKDGEPLENDSLTEALPGRSIEGAEQERPVQAAGVWWLPLLWWRRLSQMFWRLIGR